MPEPNDVSKGFAIAARVVSPRRIVVCEDDSEMRALLAAALRRDGYDVAVTSDGQDLLGYLAVDDRSCVVDLIIADQRMPGRTGLEVLAALRSLNIGVPFILMTAFCDAATRSEAGRLGAADLLDKPFQLEELRASVGKLLL